MFRATRPPASRRRLAFCAALGAAVALPAPASAAPLKATSFVRGDSSPGFVSPPAQRVIVGDLNGDGKDDAAFSLANATLTVVYGTSPSQDVDLGASLGDRALRVTSTEGRIQEVAAAGDVDRDGLDDLAVTTDTSAYVLYGSRSDAGPLTLGSGARFTKLTGRGANDLDEDIEGIGDFDGDGYDDVALQRGKNAAAIVSGGPRVASIALGSAGGRVSLITASQRCGWVFLSYRCVYLGVNIEALGDFDGDGLDDLAIENSYEDGNVVLYGRTGRFTTTPSLGAGKTRLPTPPNGERTSILGNTTRAGDVNGDGLADAIIWDSTVVLGRRGRPAAIAATDPLIRLTSSSDTPQLRFAAAGDQDGDGSDDLVAMATGSETWIPRVLTDLPAGAPATVDADQGALIGGLTLPVAETITGGGDLDGDGEPDLLVGSAPQEDSAWIVTHGTGSPNGARPARLLGSIGMRTSANGAIPGRITAQATCAGRSGPVIDANSATSTVIADGASAGDSCTVKVTVTLDDPAAWAKCTWVDQETHNLTEPVSPAGSSFTLAANDNQWSLTRICNLPLTEGPVSIGQPGWSYLGNARMFDPELGGGVVEFTTGPNQRGSAMWGGLVDWRNRTVTFSLGMTAEFPTGEGVTLAFIRPDANGQPSGGKLGFGGSLLGFGGLGGVAVAFDNRKAAADPSSNFIGFADGTSGATLRWRQTADPVSKLGAPSNNQIKVVNKAGTTTVFVNGVQRMRGPLAIPAESFIAFTAATSTYGWQFQRVYNVTFSAS